MKCKYRCVFSVKSFCFGCFFWSWFFVQVNTDFTKQLLNTESDCWFLSTRSFVQRYSILDGGAVNYTNKQTVFYLNVILDQMNVFCSFKWMTKKNAWSILMIDILNAVWFNLKINLINLISVNWNWENANDFLKEMFLWLCAGLYAYRLTMSVSIKFVV